MADFYAVYPPVGGGSSSNPSVGPNGQPAPADSTQIAGVDSGGDLTPVSVDSAGNVNVNVASTPLPPGAATAANQVTEIGHLAQIETNTTGLATEATLSSLDSKVVIADTDNVTVVASALPTGAATEATLSDLDSKVVIADTDNVTVISSALPIGAATEATLSALNGKVTTVDTDNVTVVASALPAGAATEATVATLLTDTQLRATPVPVSVTSTTITGNVTVVQPTAANLNATVTGTVAATQSGTWNINNVSGTVSLPTGASTSALQTTGNSSLSSIDSKTPALGQAVMAASSPVVIASNQSAIPVTQGANPTGSYAEITNLTTSAQTFTVPANAVGFLLEASSANSNNLLWKVGATASTTSGMILEPGRDSGYMPLAANISIIAAGGTNQIATVQWVLSV